MGIMPVATWVPRCPAKSTRLSCLCKMDGLVLLFLRLRQIQQLQNFVVCLEPQCLFLLVVHMPWCWLRT
uniref:Uncharacterized protein n=1 Tax=Arundo donax TaxID=35708 RepID=A0A0A8ZTI6_ARUDO